jgi:hypothetical protein
MPTTGADLADFFLGLLLLILASIAAAIRGTA